MMILPFDAHNHAHMGPASSLEQLITATRPCLSGMALMSTHPRDFPRVLKLANYNNDDAAAATTTTPPTTIPATDISTAIMKIVPCIGVHPWFLHELSNEDCEMVDIEIGGSCFRRPRWVSTIQNLLEEHPNLPVGEIGLDKFHFDYDTGELTTTLEKQIEAMEYQIQLASTYQRPVSIHCVRALGPIMNVLQNCVGPLPPKIYFHAFGGKVGTATQLIKTLENTNKKKSSSTTTTTKVYFGFAPIVNFQSPKTSQVLQEVGLQRLVLETDHEDASKVPSSMEMGLDVISKALDVSKEELIEITNQNAFDLYNIVLPSSSPPPPE